MIGRPLSISWVRTLHNIMARSSACSQSHSESRRADLGFWYGNGPGNPAVAAQGIGYVSEFISRLARTRITNFDTSVNGTIVSSEILFPFDQPIYVDATHDTVITAGQLPFLKSDGPQK
jgi:hypothetical protein